MKQTHTRKNNNTSIFSNRELVAEDTCGSTHLTISAKKKDDHDRNNHNNVNQFNNIRNHHIIGQQLNNSYYQCNILETYQTTNGTISSNRACQRQLGCYQQ